MEKTENLSKAVANVIFGPTILAYGWVSLRYVAAGLAFYAVFMFGAYEIRLFEDVRKWPIISQVTLGGGPLLLCVGLYFSTQPYAYTILIPAAIYLVISIAGGIALMGKFNAPDESTD
jgi:hypothetical protein